MVDNARVLAATLKDAGLDIVSGGTDSHLMLVDLRPKHATGRAAEVALERADITCNKNGVPFDTAPFTITSGIRLGSPAATTRGLRQGGVQAGRRADRGPWWTPSPATAKATPRWRRACVTRCWS